MQRRKTEVCMYTSRTREYSIKIPGDTGNLFNRVNHLRRASEFDKALSTYEDILK